MTVAMTELEKAIKAVKSDKRLAKTQSLVNLLVEAEKTVKYQTETIPRYQGVIAYYRALNEALTKALKKGVM